jgi:hypothetical protein
MNLWICRGGFAARARWETQRFSGVFIRGFPPNKKTTRQRDKTMLEIPAAPSDPNKPALLTNICRSIPPQKISNGFHKGRVRVVPEYFGKLGVPPVEGWGKGLRSNSDNQN